MPSPRLHTLLLSSCTHWNPDNEEHVFEHLRKHDRDLLRRTCSSGRKQLSREITQLILVEEEDGKTNLFSVNLEHAFPSATSLSLACSQTLESSWPERFQSFAVSNMNILKNIKHLDLGTGPSNPGSMACIGLCSSLRSLKARIGRGVSCGTWSILRGMGHLTSLHVLVDDQYGAITQSIASAAPQLRELRLHNPHGRCDLLALKSLRSLETLELECMAGRGALNGQAVQALSCLDSLSSLHLQATGDSAATAELLRGCSKLTGLQSLSVMGSQKDLPSTAALKSLAPLQHLSSLSLGTCLVLGCRQVRALAALPALRALNACLADGSAVAQLASLPLLEQADVDTAGMEGTEEADSSDDEEEEGEEGAGAGDVDDAVAGAVQQAAAALADIDLQQQAEPAAADAAAGAADAAAAAHDAPAPQQQQQALPLLLHHGALSTKYSDLHLFDLSHLTRLHVDVALPQPIPQHLHPLALAPSLAAALSSATQLQALHLSGPVLLHPLVVLAICQLPHLQHLLLEAADSELPTAYPLLHLATGCQQLRQLMLIKVGPLSRDCVAGLMALPPLEALRLLACPGAPDQEACQVMARHMGRLGLCVDAVGADGGLRAERWCAELRGRWRP
jgi:hypothetical protein